MSRSSLMLQGAAAFGIHLAADGEDLAYYCDHEVPQSTLEKIAAHRDELVAELKTRREQIAATWPELQELDADQYMAFLDVMKERIAILQNTADVMEGAARSAGDAARRRHMGAGGSAASRPAGRLSISRQPRRRAIRPGWKDRDCRGSLTMKSPSAGLPLFSYHSR